MKNLATEDGLPMKSATGKGRTDTSEKWRSNSLKDGLKKNRHQLNRYIWKLIDPAQLAYAVYVGENQGNPNFLQLTDEGLKLALESNLEKMEKALPFQNVQQQESVDDLNKRVRTILENMKK